MIIEALIFIFTSIFVYHIYKYKKLHYDLESKGVKYVPGLPIFGNSLMSTIQKKHFFDDVDEVYKAFPNERYVAYIDNTKVIILIRDPELIKHTTVKDFDHFVDHNQFFDEQLDPLFGASLFAMKETLGSWGPEAWLLYREISKRLIDETNDQRAGAYLGQRISLAIQRGDRWRNMRSTLSPAFTGSKMRHMIQFIKEISSNIVNHISDHLNEDIGVDDLMRRYTNDVIASASFGLQVNSLKDKENEFFLTGQKVLNFDAQQIFLLFASDQFPSLFRKLGMKLHKQKVYDFFRDIVSNTMKHRKSTNVHRPDMIQLLMETPREWTMEELTGQAFIFFAAGFETSASMLVMCIHELAINPDIQERLYQEIRVFKEKHGELTNDNMAELKYLDCVVNETLRRWSPAIILDRACVKTYELPPPREGGKPFVLKPGDVIFNSCNSLHLDPQYFPNPLTFDPDRFSEENKHNIKPFSFNPFGSGPRVCIGIRFAYMEIKVLIFDLLSHYKIQKCPKTTNPIELVDYGFNIKAKGGTWTQFVERT